MDIKITIEDYLTAEEIKEIVATELACKVKKAIDEQDLDRIIVNAAYRVLFQAIDDQLENNLTVLIRDEVVRIIKKLDSWFLFRRKSDFESEDSKAYVYLQDAVEQNKEILYQRVHDLMKEMDPNEMRHQISEILYNVIENKLWGNKEAE